MSEQIIAALVGGAVVGLLKVADRLLDWFLPGGHHWKGVDRYKIEDDDHA